MAFSNIIDMFRGKHATAVAFFASAGTAFQYFHKLDATYISFVTLMMSFVLGHSIKDDYFNRDQGPGGPNNGHPQ